MRRHQDGRISADLGQSNQASQNLFEQIQGRNFVGYPDEAIRTVIARATAIERR
jgi:hypothetical protein